MLQDIVVQDRIKDFIYNRTGLRTWYIRQTMQTVPAYPFYTYEITTQLQANKGTWQEGYPDGKARKAFTQEWQFVAYSDDYAEALEKALLLYEIFDRGNTAELTALGIIPGPCEDMENTDRMYETKYEYSFSFRITFNILRESLAFAQEQPVDIQQTSGG